MLKKRECLEAIEKIWRELECTGSISKTYVPEALSHLHTCPCCTYVYEQIYNQTYRGEYRSLFFDECQKHCPLMGLWPKGCEKKCSPYNDWTMCYEDDIEQRKIYAGQIADYAKDLLQNKII